LCIFQHVAKHGKDTLMNRRDEFTDRMTFRLYNGVKKENSWASKSFDLYPSVFSLPATLVPWHTSSRNHIIC